MADVTAIQADLVERARLFIDEGASEDPRSLVEGLLMLLDLHDPPSAPVPAVTRDQAWKALSDLREEFEECDDSDCLDHWCALARRGAAALEALLAEAPAATAELVDGIPEHLHVDMESTIHQHMGHDGQSDETNDWVTDLMSALCPLIERALVLAEAPQPKVLWEGETLPTYRESHTMSGPSLVRGSVVPRVDVSPGTPVAVVALGPPVPEAPEPEAGPDDLSFPVWPDGRPRPEAPETTDG